MKRMIFMSFVFVSALLMAACANGDSNMGRDDGNGAMEDNHADIPGGSAKGFAVGETFDGESLTIGEGALEGKGVYVTYFATW